MVVFEDLRLGRCFDILNVNSPGTVFIVTCLDLQLWKLKLVKSSAKHNGSVSQTML